MAYKHRDIVIAWMDGAVIEHQLDDGRWYTLGPCTNKVQHAFIEDRCYRIKPEPVMIRHATWKHDPIVATYLKNYNPKEDALLRSAESDSDLVWLDDWHEAGFSAPDI